jgi:4-hydroxythreonine-4-phosphate dehydrogenase
MPLKSNPNTTSLKNRCIGITMGCPVGIGPEILIKFLNNYNWDQPFKPVVIGSHQILKQCSHDLELKADLHCINHPDEIINNKINIIEPELHSRLTLANLKWGCPNLNTGKLMASCIEDGVKLTLKGNLAAIVTCPITKTALNAAGYNYPGHTEMLGSLCKENNFAMMMAGKQLKITLVTIHIALNSINKILSPEKIINLIKITHRALRVDFGIKQPRIAVAGLNPHAGEDGLFGDEEINIIGPALANLPEGILAEGPFPPDTVFNKAVENEFDAVVCMYHDQGLIPFKLLHFEDGVNITLGLPIIRTSVDHGTAYDIAGKGIASPLSLSAAFEMAGEIAVNRERNTSND